MRVGVCVGARVCGCVCKRERERDYSLAASGGYYPYCVVIIRYSAKDRNFTPK